jgi:Xaa-Pro aminopeptidase
MFNAKTYIQRRYTLKQKIGSGLILFLGNDESPMNYPDNTYPFRQDSTFLYYFGISHPGLAAVIDIDNDKEILFGEDYTLDDIVWMGPQPTIHERAGLCGVTVSMTRKELFFYLHRAQAGKQTIHFLPLYRPENKIVLQELLGIKPGEIQGKYSASLVKAIVSQREIKTREEIKEITKAVDGSTDMHIAAMRYAKPGMTEAEVTAEIHKVALALGGNIAFPIIATINGQTLHIL